jgi:NRPS condensation-like uncharacterized protein
LIVESSVRNAESCRTSAGSKVRSASGAIYLMMPINLRPTEWRLDVLGNFASYVSVRVGSSDVTTLENAIQAAAASTRLIKDGAIAGLIVDLFGAPTILPTAVKRRMQDLIPPHPQRRRRHRRALKPRADRQRPAPR